MKRSHLLFTGLLFGGSVQAQGGWTLVTDANNPINSFPSNFTYRGAAWVDVDNDGDIDLFASPGFLFRNDGGGAFTELTTIIGMNNQQDPAGTSWADLDNDGFIDCITAAWPSSVYLNNGDGTFTDQTLAIDSLNDFGAWGCAIGNLDGDAFLDLVFVQAAGFTSAPPHGCRLLSRSSISLSATMLTGYACTDSLKPYTVPYWSDHDLDGDMDLFIATGPAGTLGYDYCYRNMRVELGQDTLYRMTTEAFASVKQDGQCYNFIDTDNDGDLDLCLTNYNGAPSRFYRNDAGSYTSITTPFTTTHQRLGNVWGDYDNDGDLDVIVNADAMGTRYYRNEGGNTFVLASPGLSSASGAGGITNGDYDNDGDLDVFQNGLNSQHKLFRNDTLAQDGHWVSIRLEGVQSNRSAIGAIVRITATINGADVTQVREVNAQNGFQSQNDLRVHFGLGDAVAITSVAVVWPSGIEQLLGPADRDQFYTLLEGGALTTSIADGATAPPLLTLFPDPANNALNVSTARSTMRIDWRLIAMDGKEVSAGRSMGGPFMVDVSGLTGGRYVLRCQIGTSAVALPFVKL